MAKEKQPKNKKSFFKDFKAELKKVIWPTPKQVANNTTAVVTIVLLTAIIVFILDEAFIKLNTHGIDKIRSIVSTQETNNISNSISENTINNNIVENNNTVSE